MPDPDGDCSGCRESVYVDDGEIDALITSLGYPESERVGLEAYRRRLELCAGCRHLRYGTTCMQCGCLVRIRAILADSHCPDPSGSGW